MMPSFPGDSLGSFPMFCPIRVSFGHYECAQHQTGGYRVLKSKESAGDVSLAWWLASPVLLVGTLDNIEMLFT